MSKGTKILGGAEIRKLALTLYEVELSNSPKGTTSLSPAGAVKAAAKAAGRNASSIVEGVYFRENGTRNPLGATAAKNARSLAVAVRKRRDGGGTLGRWTTVAASISATLGRPVSEVEAKAIYAKGGGDLEASYTGRGTRVAAPKTYADPAATIEATTKK